MGAIMKAVQNGDEAAVERLITQGADVNELDGEGNAPVIMAAYLGHAGILRRLLDAGGDLTALDPGMKATALHAAAYAGHAGTAAILVERGIDVDKQGPHNGYTALHDAIWQGNTDVARVLIDAGARLDLKSNDGHTPLEFARARRRRDIAGLIERALETRR